MKKTVILLFISLPNLVMACVPNKFSLSYFLSFTTYGFVIRVFIIVILALLLVIFRRNKIVALIFAFVILFVFIWIIETINIIPKSC